MDPGTMGRFFAAIWANTVARLSGLAGIVFTVIAFLVGGDLQPKVFLAIAVLCLLYSPYPVWADLARQVRTPASLRLFFDPADPRCILRRGNGALLRIGIRNEGLQRAENVSLVTDGHEPASQDREAFGDAFVVSGSNKAVTSVGGDDREYMDVLECVRADDGTWSANVLSSKDTSIRRRGVGRAPEITVSVRLKWEGAARHGRMTVAFSGSEEPTARFVAE